MFTFLLLNIESNMTQVYFDKLILDCLETKFSVSGPNWYNMIKEEVRNLKLCSSTSRRLDNIVLESFALKNKDIIILEVRHISCSIPCHKSKNMFLSCLISFFFPIDKM